MKWEYHFPRGKVVGEVPFTALGLQEAAEQMSDLYHGSILSLSSSWQQEKSLGASAKYSHHREPLLPPPPSPTSKNSYREQGLQCVVQAERNL